MNYCSTLICGILVIFDVVLAREYCAHEYFNPQCRDDEVIVMEKAIYGRMESGKCIKIQFDSSKSDMKYFGCKADVLDVLDKKCSGRQKCSMLVMDQALMERSTCYEELVHYLEADYFCQPVIRIDSTCSVGLHGNPIHLLAGVKPGIKKQERCGGASNPLSFEASVGQNIKVSVVMFHQPNKTLVSEAHEDQMVLGRCATQGMETVSYLLGTITESSDRFPRKPFCTFHGRQTQVMMSQTNKIQVEINFDIEARFLLILEATGCYDLKPPQDAWMKREGNEVTVGCYMNRHTWKLFCNGRNWVGVIGNCTQQTGDILELKDNSFQEDKRSSNEAGTVFLLAIGASLAVLMVLSLTCGFMVHCQKSKSSKFQGSAMYIESTNRPLFNVAINGDLQALHGKEANGKLESSYQDPGYYVLENDKEAEDDKKN